MLLSIVGYKAHMDYNLCWKNSVNYTIIHVFDVSILLVMAYNAEITATVAKPIMNMMEKVYLV